MFAQSAGHARRVLRITTESEWQALRDTDNPHKSGRGGISLKCLAF
jgi:hypothetical protein